MAAGRFRSQAFDPPGIPLAYGRAVHRLAKGNQARRQKEGLLTIVQNREKYFLPYVLYCIKI